MNHIACGSSGVRTGLYAWGKLFFFISLAVCPLNRSVQAQALAPAEPVARTSAPIATDALTGYKHMVPSERLTSSKKEENRFRTLVQGILTGKVPLEENRSTFDAYYTWFSFPLMTQTTEDALQSLPERRHRLFRTEIEICTVPEVHAHLVALTLEQMSVIVQDSFHPAVRYNAMLIISSLNDQDIVRIGSEKKLPEPMARALPFMLQEFKRPENSDAIKVAALVGVSRHLEWDPHRPQTSAPIPAALRGEIIAELLSVAQNKAPPANRNAEGHLWFRRRAVEALGLACVNKLEPPVADAMDKLLRDPTEPLDLRFAVATAIGRMNYQQPAALDTQRVAKELGYLALLACDSELNRLANLRKTEEEQAARINNQGVSNNFGGGAEFGGDPMGGAGPAMAGPAMAGPAMPGMGGFGAGQGRTSRLEDPKGYRFDYARRRIRHQLYCVQFGLTGGDDFDPKKGAAPAPADGRQPRGVGAYAKAGAEKKYVVDVYAQVRTLADIVENKAVDLAQLNTDLRKNMKALEGMTKKLGAAPATETPAGAAPAGDLPVAPPAAKPAAAPADAVEIPAAPPAAVAAPPAAAGKAPVAPAAALEPAPAPAAP